ncbi:hypothetical protein Tco_1442947, partial [Tanacetum coccineum]
ECYRALTNQLDWTNPKGHKSLVDMCNPLSLQDKEGRLTIPVEFFFNNDLEYLKVGNSERTYSSFITKTSAARVIYEDKSKKKRLMRVDEIHKFCDGTFQSVHNINRQRLQNFRLGYNNDMPSRQWTYKDKRRTCIMLNKIDDQLLKRRIMRSLEVLASPLYVQKAFDNRCTYAGGAFPKDENIKVVKVRYDTKGVKVRMEIMQTKTELTLEQTQQGVSDRVVVSIEGVEE